MSILKVFNIVNIEYEQVFYFKYLKFEFREMYSNYSNILEHCEVAENELRLDINSCDPTYIQ